MSENGVNTYMPVVPQGGYGNDGFLGGGNGLWFLLIWMAMFGWGGNGFGFGNGGGYGREVQQGFDQAALTGGINNILGAINNGFANAETAANSRQMADMNQNFAMQSALQNCCCENRAATADLKYTIATEACNNRQALADSTQRILDQMCNDKIDAKNEKIADLERQLTMMNLAASQNAQTAAILANNEAQTTALERYLAPTPIPAYVVQNPNCCQQNWNCGCGNV